MFNNTIKEKEGDKKYELKELKFILYYFEKKTIKPTRNYIARSRNQGI